LFYHICLAGHFVDPAPIRASHVPARVFELFRLFLALMPKNPIRARRCLRIAAGLLSVVLPVSDGNAQTLNNQNSNVLMWDMTNTFLLRPEFVYERVFRGGRTRPFSLQAALGYAVGMKPREGGRSFFIQNYFDDYFPMLISNGVTGSIGWMKFFSDKGSRPGQRYGRYIGVRMSGKSFWYKDAPVVVHDTRHPGQYFDNRVQDQQRKKIGLQFCTGTRQMIGRSTLLDFYLAVGPAWLHTRTTITQDLINPSRPPVTEEVTMPTSAVNIGLRIGREW
jgi:hypothetical protein